MSDVIVDDFAAQLQQVFLWGVASVGDKRRYIYAWYCLV